MNSRKSRGKFHMKTQKSLSNFHLAENQHHDPKWVKAKDTLKTQINHLDTIETTLSSATHPKRSKSISMKNLFNQSKKVAPGETFKRKNKQQYFHLSNHSTIDHTDRPSNQKPHRNQIMSLFQNYPSKIKSKSKLTLSSNQSQVQIYANANKHNKLLRNYQKILDIKLQSQKGSIAQGSLLNISDITSINFNISKNPSLKTNQIDKKGLILNSVSNSQSLLIDNKVIKKQQSKQIEVQTDQTMINMQNVINKIVEKQQKIQQHKQINNKQNKNNQLKPLKNYQTQILQNIQFQNIPQIKQKNKNQQKNQQILPKQQQNIKIVNQTKPSVHKIEKKQKKQSGQFDDIEQIKLGYQQKSKIKINNPVKQIHKQEKPKQTAINSKNIKENIIKNKQLLDTIIPVGQVAGYCAKLLKKSKLNWIQPSLLLYKEVYRQFKAAQILNKQAYEQKIITKQQLNLFLQQNMSLKSNLEKIIKSAQKKQKLKQKYKKLVQPQQTTPLSFFIYQEIICITKQFLKSDQLNDNNTCICILRMLNAALILLKVSGIKKVPRINNIEELQPGEVKQLIPIILGKIQQKL